MTSPHPHSSSCMASPPHPPSSCMAFHPHPSSCMASPPHHSSSCMASPPHHSSCMASRRPFHPSYLKVRCLPTFSPTLPLSFPNIFHRWSGVPPHLLSSSLHPWPPIRPSR